MFNWNNAIRGQGFPIQNNPAQMVNYGAPGQPMAFNAASMPFQAAQWGHQQQQFPQGMGMMPMLAQQPPQWQQMQQFPPQPQPGIFHPQGMRMGFIGGVNPAPPSFPPPEEKPPLPSDPPPPLPSTPHETRPPLPNEQPKPPLPTEDSGPRPPAGPAPEKPAPPARPPSPDPVVLAELEKVKKEEEVFLEQYKQWKKQYDDWRDQNQNHPNKEQYEQYLNQWKTYEGQMESRRKNIADQIASLEEKIAESREKPEFPINEQQKFSLNSKSDPNFGNDHVSKSSPFSRDGHKDWKSLTPNDPSSAKGQQNTEGHHSIDGDDIGEEDMNLDDEEETAGGGIIESSSHPPPHDSWPNRPPERLELSSQEYGKQWEHGPEDKPWESHENSFQGGPPNEEIVPVGPPKFPGRPGESRFPMNSPNELSGFPGGPRDGEIRFPGGPQSGGPRFPGGPQSGGPRFPGGPHNGGPRFSGGPQEWEQSSLGPGGFSRGRGMAGQGPRFGWRGGGGPRFQMPPSQERDGFTEQSDSGWNDYDKTSSGYQDDIGKIRTEDSEYKDQEDWYGEKDNESQLYDDSNYGANDSGFGAGRDFPHNRGRGGPGSFPRGRGGEMFGNRGRGFDRGRGGAFNRGGYCGFPRGGALMGRDEQYGEETNEPDHYNATTESIPWSGRGRGGFPARGRGGFQGSHINEYGDDAQNDTQEDGNVDDIERQAQLQYDDEGQHNQEAENYQMDSHGRGRGGMFRGRGRGGFASYGNKESSQTDREHYDSQNYYDNPQDEFNNRGRGTFSRPGFMGRGRGEMNTTSEGLLRGSQRGRGAFRGRGGHGANFPDGGEPNDSYDYGGQHGNEEFQAHDEMYPTQSSGNRGRGRGASFSFGRGRGAFPQRGEKEFVQDHEPLWNKDNQETPNSRGFGSRPGMRREADWSQMDEDTRNNAGFADESQAETLKRPSMYGDRDPGDNTATPQTLDKEDEPLVKRGRFDFDGRDPYDHLPPPFQFGDRLPDPYDRFPDPYSRDPHFDPYGLPPYDRFSEYDRFGRYERGLPEKKPFVPAESIDYGHGEADKEKKRAALQQKEVIDYGHGQASESNEDSSSKNDQQGGFGFRHHEGRSLDVDERQDNQHLRYQNDISFDKPKGREFEIFDYSNASGQESRREEFGNMYGDVQSNRNYSDSGRRGGDNLPGGSDHSFGDRMGKRREHSEDLYDRNRIDRYNRDSDDQIKRDSKDPYDRNRDDRYGRDIDKRYNRDMDDRYDRDRDRGRNNRLSPERSSLYNRDLDESLSRDRQRDRDMPYSRDTRREGSPRWRASEFDDRFGGEKGSPSRREDHSKGRDRLRVEDTGDTSRTYGRDISPFRRRLERDDPYSSLGHDSMRSTDSRGGTNRWAEKDPYGMGSSPKDQRYGVMPGARDIYGEGNMSSPARNSPMGRGPPAPVPLPVAEFKKVEDLLCPPGRQSRPPQLVVIIRGLPGSGKTYVSKLLREKEIKFGGAAPRMLCLDDYFMVEVEKQEIDPDTGKKVRRKVLEYEYEQPVEEAYRQSLLKSFKKTVDDGFFPFIIVDATNEKVVHFSEFWSYAKSRGFQVYVGELNVDVATCIQRNIHNWTEWDIEKVKSNWEPLPNHYIRLDLRWLLQDDSIAEVEMEDTDPNEAKEEKEKKEEEDEDKAQDEDEEETGFESIYKKSKWELDSSEKTLDKLDGIPVSKKHIAEHQSLKDYLQLDQPDQLDDDYFSRESLPGKKRVRWADLEEKKTQDRRRDLGFIVGQTQRDWERITDDDFATKALNQTKYFYKN